DISELFHPVVVISARLRTHRIDEVVDGGGGVVGLGQRLAIHLLLHRAGLVEEHHKETGTLPAQPLGILRLRFHHERTLPLRIVFISSAIICNRLQSSASPLFHRMPRSVYAAAPSGRYIRRSTH